MNNKILITGANGFVGRYLVKRFLQNKLYKVHATSKRCIKNTNKNLVFLDDIDIVKNKNWMAELNSIDYLVHCAGVAHEKYHLPESAQILNSVNVQGTINLVRQAIQKRVKKFIFISSIKVNGEHSKQGILNADDLPKPTGLYASSKFQAENELRLLTEGTETQLVIVRPPLIYGPGLKANFLKLIKTISRSYLIPTNCFPAYRSYVHLENLYEFINICLLNSNADGETFLVSDGDDLTLDELILLILRILERKPVMVPLSSKIIELFLKVAGRKSEVRKLMDPLQVSIEKNERLLKWTPRISFETGLRQTLYDESIRGLLPK